MGFLDDRYRSKIMNNDRSAGNNVWQFSWLTGQWFELADVVAVSSQACGLYISGLLGRLTVFGGERTVAGDRMCERAGIPFIYHQHDNATYSEAPRLAYRDLGEYD